MNDKGSDPILTPMPEYNDALDQFLIEGMWYGWGKLTHNEQGDEVYTLYGGGPG